MPPDVATALQIHPEGQGKRCVFCVHADAHLEGAQGSSDIVLYGHSQDTEAAALVLRALDRFLSLLDHEGTDVVSLIFLNFEPLTFTLQPQPPAFAREASSATEGIRLFCQGVVGSIQGEGMWSSCDWAMLSFSRAVAE
jgi:hypothetical protein